MTTTGEKVTVTKALTGYFNVGDGKRSAQEWLAELKKFTTDEKEALAREVCTVTGQTLTDAAGKPI